MSGEAGPEGAAGRVGEPAPGAADGREEGQALRYRLDLSDALEWERVSPAYRRRDRLALAGAVFAGLALLRFGNSHLDILPRLHSLSVAAVILLLPLLAVRLLQLRDRRARAGARLGAEGVDVVLEVGRDRLVERRADRATAVVMGARSLREVTEGAAHVFLATREDVIILPARALGGAEAKREFAAAWRAKVG